MFTRARGGMVDTLSSGGSAFGRGGSTPLVRTFIKPLFMFEAGFFIERFSSLRVGLGVFFRILA